MAGDEGFEPPIAEPESAALPLGQSPLQRLIILKFILFEHSDELAWATVTGAI